MQQIIWKTQRMGLWALLALLALLVLAGCAPGETATQGVEITGVTVAPQVEIQPVGSAYPAQPEEQPATPLASTAATPYPGQQETAAARPADASPAAPTPNISATPPSDAQDPKPAPAETLPADAVLRLTRSGGIAGIHETWTVYTDGRVEVSRRVNAPAEDAGQLTPAQVQTLLAELERLGFFDLQPEYGPKNACCDMITATLQARSGERQHTVTMLQGQDDTPAKLLQALEAVNALLQAAKK
jgi:hypothetical protein